MHPFAPGPEAPTRLDARATQVSPAPCDRPAAVHRVLIGRRGEAPEARIRIGDGLGGAAEIRLTVMGDGKTVAWQLLTATTGSRDTLSDVMREVRLRLRRRGIVLTVEGEDERPAPGDPRRETAR